MKFDQGEAMVQVLAASFSTDYVSTLARLEIKDHLFLEFCAAMGTVAEMFLEGLATTVATYSS
jgi:hypothetical protein